MGVKRVVLDENKNKKTKTPNRKKKKSCCCSCLIGAVVTFAVVLAIGAGVGWYFGDQFTRNNLGMSLGECFSAVGGLYSPNEKKIVTNEYSEDDLDGFYDGLKHAVFLKESTDITVESVLEAIEQDSANKSSKLLNETADTDVEQDEQSGDSALMKYVAALFVKENIDFDRLENYDEEHHSDYLLSVSDKGLAAFADDLIVMMTGKDSEIGKKLAEYGIDDLSEYLSLRQIIMEKQTRAVTTQAEEQEPVTEEKEVSMLSLTVHIKLADLLKPVLKKAIQNDFLAGLAHVSLKALLPNNLYVTVGMGLDYDVGLDIRINNIDTQEKADKAFKLIDGIMAMTGNNNTLEQTINGFITANLRPTLDKADAYADFSNVTDGKMTIDPFNMIIELMMTNEINPDEDKLTSRDLLSTFSSLVTSDYKDAISPEHTYMHQYKSEDSQAENFSEKYSSVYDPALITAENLIDYREEFLKEVSEKYLINLDPDGTPDSGDEIEFNDLMALFGIGTSDKKLELMQLIDGKRMEELLGDQAASEIRVKINDRMMGAIVSSAVGGILGESDFAAYDMRVEQVILKKSDISAAGEDMDWRNFLELGVSVSTDSMLGSMKNNPLGSIASAFLSERVMLSVNVDITRGLAEQGKEPVKTAVRYNDLTTEKTSEALRVIGKIIASLNIDQLLQGLETPLNQMLDTMYSVMASIEFGESAVVLPDIFTAMSEMLFTTTDETSGEAAAVVTGDEIREMLRGMVGSGEENYVSDVLGVAAASDDYDAFTAQIKDKYYIGGDQHAETFTQIFDIVSMETFDSGKFDIDSLKSDNRDASELTPMITDAELAHIFEEAMGGDQTLGNMAKIAGIHVGTENEGTADERRYIKLAIELNLVGGLGSDIASVLPSDVVYIVAVSYVSDVVTDESGTYYRTEVSVNEMNEAQKTTLQKMMNHLQGESAMDLEQQAVGLGKIIYEQFATLSASLGEDGYAFVNGGIELIDFYSFLARATNMTQSEGYDRGDFGATKAEIAENIKGAVQGLYARNGQQGSKYNYDKTDIVLNPVSDHLTVDNYRDWFESEPTVTAQGHIKGTMTDVNFGAFIADKFSANGGRLAELTVISAATRAASPGKLAPFEDEMNAYGITDISKDYLRLVVEMDFDSLTGGNTSIETFLPAGSKIYATVYIEVVPNPDSSEMRSVAVRLNSMSKQQQAALLQIAGMDESKLADTVNESLDAVGEYVNASYGDSGVTGHIGNITGEFDFMSKQ